MSAFEREMMAICKEAAWDEMPEEIEVWVYERLQGGDARDFIDPDEVDYPDQYDEDDCSAADYEALEAYLASLDTGEE